MQKYELVYLVLAAAFISVFTNNPVGGENLESDIPSAVWIRLQPITSPYSLCQSKMVFSEEYERTIIYRTMKKTGPVWWNVKGKILVESNLHWHQKCFLFKDLEVSLSERLTPTTTCGSHVAGGQNAENLPLFPYNQRAV